ncbi:glutathione S-transferase family protein [Phenylobacterium sp.]|uniref:glutathione S-transferase family protein n=1 Tax=Phenylobacterium sp. TaxID=1871053 RepID=UPI003D2D6155
MIELFTADTPNGIKIPIALEELGAPYVVRMMKLGSPELRSPEFAQVNPNGKIPAIRDHSSDGGPPITAFESGAILLHLAETFGGLLGATPQARAQTLSWLFLQVAGLGPALGNAGHFRGLRAPDPYATKRFQGEAARLLGLLEQRLRDSAWLNGESYSVADIAHFGWVRRMGYGGFALSDFPALSAWVDRIEARPATSRAIRRLSQGGDAPLPAPTNASAVTPSGAT